MATPEITLRGEIRDAVIGCVVRDIESSLDAVQAEYGTALQTFDCLDLLNARAHARSLANAIELLARLIDPDRVEQEIQREHEFAELQQDEQPAAGEELDGAVRDEATGDDGAADDAPVASWIEDDDPKTASNWIGDAVKLPDFLEAPRRNDRFNEAGAP